MFQSLERQVHMRFEYLDARHKTDEQKTERMHMFLKEKAGGLKGDMDTSDTLGNLEQQMKGLLEVFLTDVEHTQKTAARRLDNLETMTTNAQFDMMPRPPEGANASSSRLPHFAAMGSNKNFVGTSAKPIQSDPLLPFSGGGPVVPHPSPSPHLPPSLSKLQTERHDLQKPLMNTGSVSLMMASSNGDDPGQGVSDFSSHSAPLPPPPQDGYAGLMPVDDQEIREHPALMKKAQPGVNGYYDQMPPMEVNALQAVVDGVMADNSVPMTEKIMTQALQQAATRIFQAETEQVQSLVMSQTLWVARQKGVERRVNALESRLLGGSGMSGMNPLDSSASGMIPAVARSVFPNVFGASCNPCK
jgi:hypothetical protein